MLDYTYEQVNEAAARLCPYQDPIRRRAFIDAFLKGFNEYDNRLHRIKHYLGMKKLRESLPPGEKGIAGDWNFDGPLYPFDMPTGEQ